MRPLIILVTLLAIAGCTMTQPQGTPAAAPVIISVPQEQKPNLTADQVANNFVFAVERMRPILVKHCNEMAQNVNCNFQIVIDDRAGSPPNAYQTINDRGQPELGFTVSLLRDMWNRDEIAFVIGHEGAHHILQHLEKQRQSAVGGAVVFGILAVALGGSAESVDAATNIGASVGARSYSKDFELEADHLGARMTLAGGFDPIRGAAYFTRIPDPGNRFLGTHPPNGARITTVRAAVGR